MTETQETLCLLGKRSHNLLLEVEAKRHEPHKLQTFLQEIEATVYRLACELADMKVAGTCDECPSAPATTTAQAHLLVLADELERQADVVRKKALIQESQAQ